MPFWVDVCSIFDPNLSPKIHQNRSKIDAKMPSHVELLFRSIFACWGPLGMSLGGILGRLGGILGRLEAIWAVLERSWLQAVGPATYLAPPWGAPGALQGPPWPRPGGPASLTRTCRGPAGDLPGTSRGPPGVLLARGPPGAAPRARTRQIVNLYRRS